MVLPSIEHLKAPGTGGLKPGGRLSAWAAAATDSDYSTLDFFLQILNMFHQLPNTSLAYYGTKSL